MTASVRIRPARLEDAAAIAALAGELGYPASADDIARRLRNLLDRPEEQVLVAELVPGGVVGWIHGSEEFLLEYDRRALILGLVVGEAHRARGVGRELVAAVEAWAGGRGMDLIGVRSNVVREEAHPFYERLGYRRVKTQHAYRKALPPDESG